MNVLFHVTTAVGVVAAITPTDKIKNTRKSIPVSCLAFITGIMVHGILDYVPHNYPLGATIDTILALIMMILLFFLSKSPFKLVMASALLGSIFPDLVDLLPSILNKYFELDLPINAKIFPWHYPQYSGSIFSESVNLVSNINHSMVIFLTIIICYMRKKELSRIFL